MDTDIHGLKAKNNRPKCWEDYKLLICKTRMETDCIIKGKYPCTSVSIRGLKYPFVSIRGSKMECIP